MLSTSKHIDVHVMSFWLYRNGVHHHDLQLQQQRYRCVFYVDEFIWLYCHPFMPGEQHNFSFLPIRHKR
jgi:hypothetical protein